MQLSHTQIILKILNPLLGLALRPWPLCSVAAPRLLLCFPCASYPIRGQRKNKSLTKRCHLLYVLRVLNVIILSHQLFFPHSIQLLWKSFICLSTELLFQILATSASLLFTGNQCPWNSVRFLSHLNLRSLHPIAEASKLSFQDEHQSSLTPSWTMSSTPSPFGNIISSLIRHHIFHWW